MNFVNHALIFFLSLCQSIHAFLPKAFLVSQHVLRASPCSGYPLHATVPATPVLEASSAIASSPSSSLIVADALGVISNIVLVVGGLFGVLLLFAVLFISFIIPKAAEELERQVQKDYPELWEEYSAQLKEGELLASRPDLIQELGEKIQALQMEQFESQEILPDFPPTVTPPTSEGRSASSTPSSSTIRKENIVDAEVVEEDDGKNKK